MSSAIEEANRLLRLFNEHSNAYKVAKHGSEFVIDDGNSERPIIVETFILKLKEQMQVAIGTDVEKQRGNIELAIQWAHPKLEELDEALGKNNPPERY